RAVYRAIRLSGQGNGHVSVAAAAANGSSTMISPLAVTLMPRPPGRAQSTGGRGRLDGGGPAVLLREQCLSTQMTVLRLSTIHRRPRASLQEPHAAAESARWRPTRRC